MKTYIVIGIGYGDEGKGITVDNLAKVSKNPIVIRFSGGQQCGHTVFHTEDKMHIHNSYGSGALRGVPSYISGHCTMYLNRIVIETKTLNKIVGPAKSKLMINGFAKVTTPYDVVFNRIRERKTQHGSTGWGMGSTMHRHLHTGYKINVVDFNNPAIFIQKLRNIQEYYKARVGLYNVTEKEFQKECLNEVQMFMESLNHWWDYFQIEDDYSILTEFDTVIFEGSQGIMLDMEHGIYPNVTYSHTTSKNAIEICNEVGLNDPEMYYVTRSYYTRHGNGWVANEDKIELVNNECEVNIKDPWQGEFKVREIDPGLLNYALKVDALYAGFTSKNLVITCLDQRKDDFSLNTLIESLPLDFENIFTTSSPITQGLTKVVLVEA